MPFVDFGERAESVPAPTVSGLVHDIPLDRRPIPMLGMFVLKIYAFGGLAFLVGTILAAISYWIWVVIIKREYADSPPWLDLHPERMRAREVARVARLKAKKEEKRQDRERREKEKFSVPPLQLAERDNQNRSSSAPISSATTKGSETSFHKVPVVGDNPGNARPKSSSVSLSSTLGKQSIAARPKSSSVSTLGKSPLLTVDSTHVPPGSTPRPRKSSFSTGNKSPEKRVSWASATATLDVNGCADMMPISGKSAEPYGGSKFVEHVERHDHDHDNDQPRLSTLMPIPSHSDLLSTVPRARTASPRISVALDPHARRGPEMIAATTPDVARNWAREADSYDEHGYCRCWSSTDSLGRVHCDVHAP